MKNQLTAAIILMGMFLTGCSASNQPSAQINDNQPDNSEQAQATSEDSNDLIENEKTQDPAANESDHSEENRNGSGERQEEKRKILVAYFSATGTTQQPAAKIAQGLNADLFQIEPEQPYTDADLDWNDDSSRSSVEMNDVSSRPAIANQVENMNQYDVIFLGYPIWWGQAPKIISTFLESYDFAGKTIIPFCTSGSSPIGDSGKNLEGLTDGVLWQEGARFKGSDTQEILMQWIDTLELDSNSEDRTN